MAFKVDETIFGNKQFKKLNIGDLVSWTEWIWEQPGIVDPDGSEPVHSRRAECIGIISELYIEDREIRQVAMAKVVPMNNKKDKSLREKNMLVTSLKLVSTGGYIGGKKDNGVISE
jgi:hypothetical protein